MTFRSDSDLHREGKLKLDPSELPPGTPVLLLAHDLSAALSVGDARRAYESAAALSQAAGLIAEVLEFEDWKEAAESARRRLRLDKETE